MMYRDLTVRFVIVYDMPEEAKDEAIEDITESLEQGHLLHRIAHRFPLAETARSHELVEQAGFRGCVVVDCAR
jgi:NADPH:quinone reductase-like Zn-dependent oxidoreductase